MPISREEADYGSDVHPQEMYAVRMMLLQENFGFSYLGARVQLCEERNEDVESIVEEMYPDGDEKTKEEICSRIYQESSSSDEGILIIDEKSSFEELGFSSIDDALGRFGHSSVFITYTWEHMAKGRWF